MECQACFEHLTAFLDAELSDQERTAVEHHLEACAGCRDEYQSLLFASRLTERASQMEVNASLWRRVRAGIGEQVPEAAKAPAAWMHPFPSFRWLPIMGMAALVLLLMAGGMFWQSYRDGLQAEETFRAYLSQREQTEQRHQNLWSAGAGAAMERIYSNPFTDHDHEAEKNPFAVD